LARLIRERPVSVNLAERHIRVSSKRRNLPEYVNVHGVFPDEDGGHAVCALDRGAEDIIKL
jgi:hypothetical protein